MYIDKKTLPEYLREDINIKQLENILINEKNNYDTFEYSLNYNNQYLIDVECSYYVHNKKGMKWNITGIKRIYGIENNQILSYSVI